MRIKNEKLFQTWKPAFVNFQQNQSLAAVQRTIDSTDRKDPIWTLSAYFLHHRNILWTEFNQNWESKAKDCIGRVTGGCYLGKLCIWGLSWSCTNWFKGLPEPRVTVYFHSTLSFHVLPLGPKSTFHLLQKTSLDLCICFVSSIHKYKWVLPSPNPMLCHYVDRTRQDRR